MHARRPVRRKQPAPLQRAASELWNRVNGPAPDMAREGTLTTPDRTALPVADALADVQPGQTLGEALMPELAHQPSGERTVPEDDTTLRVFVPGLNTPEPESSRRTQYYADHLGQPMLHLHNGTHLNGEEGGQLDYLEAAAVRLGLKETPLMESFRELLQAALMKAEPEEVHAILYSDATIGGTRVIKQLRRDLIQKRLSDGVPGQEATAQVDALLDEHLFVELHGNAAKDLVPGPRWALWTDIKDGFTHNQPLGFGPELGLSGRQRDADANAMYLDYDGPFSGGDAHNLASTGVHAVRAIWEANGVSSTQELFEQVGPVHMPPVTQGDASESWGP